MQRFIARERLGAWGVLDTAAMRWVLDGESATVAHSVSGYLNRPERLDTSECADVARSILDRS